MKLSRTLLSRSLIAGGLCAISATATAASYYSPPSETVFSDNQQLNVTLSNTNPNKIQIEGERIIKLDGMDGAYQASNSDDGSVILTPTSGQAFTVFIQTEHNISVSLNVTPRAGVGKTLTLLPDSVPALSNDAARSWEEGEPYIDTLKSIAHDVVNGKVPPDFIDYPVRRAQAYQPAAGVQLTPERQLLGSHLRVVRYRMTNPGSITQHLQERQFYAPGVRAVALSTAQLYPGGQGFAWVIFAYNGGGDK